MRSVFAPNPPPPAFSERTRLPLMLRPKHFLANSQDNANLFTAVAALSQRYGAIPTPTEIVTGDFDGVVSAAIHAEGCLRDIAGARLTILPGVGHSPHHAAPDRVVEVVVAAERRARATQIHDVI